ncbi:MAG: response regulator [Gammaproteobacteria bacterium]|jgi:two-component system LytT family response regulator
MSSNSIRALLIDDEILARLALRQALASHEDVAVVGECSNADEAAQAIQALSPDVLFVDIEMPGMDGFELLRGLNPNTLPLVIFATAYSQHALRAFEVGAIDYVLKPIDQARFDKAMARVKSQWQSLTKDHPVKGAARNNQIYIQRLSVRSDDYIRLVQVDDIDWIRATGNYIELHVGDTCFLHRESLRRLLGSLDPSKFLRIHRGIAVNVDRILEIHPLPNGNAEIVLHDGTRLSVSRRFREDVRNMLGDW